MNQKSRKVIQAITEESTIGEILSSFPDRCSELIREMKEFGVGSVTCCSVKKKTLRSMMLDQKQCEVGKEQLRSLIMKLNDIVNRQEGKMQRNVFLTPSAAEKFHDLCQFVNKKGWGIRLGIDSKKCGGFEYRLDFSQKADREEITFYSQGIAIYVRENELSYLNGSEIDYDESFGFQINHVHEGACGLCRHSDEKCYRSEAKDCDGCKE